MIYAMPKTPLTVKPIVPTLFQTSEVVSERMVFGGTLGPGFDDFTAQSDFRNTLGRKSRKEKSKTNAVQKRFNLTAKPSNVLSM
jgi:molybdopterin-biosynthesis enzyme MoeA-like protein